QRTRRPPPPRTSDLDPARGPCRAGRCHRTVSPPTRRDGERCRRDRAAGAPATGRAPADCANRHPHRPARAAGTPPDPGPGVTIKHIAMVVEAEGLDGPEKLLLLAYCNRTDDHGYCWPGQQRLADDCGTSLATVKRTKKRLIEKKLIASMRRVDPRTGEPIS